MKKLMVVLVILCILFTIGCSNKSNALKTYSVPIIVLPDENTAYTVNGYKKVSNSNPTSSQSSSDKECNIKYFGNKKSKKLHTSDCRYVKNMKDDNLVIFEKLSDAENEGYTGCSVCSPQ